MEVQLIEHIRHSLLIDRNKDLIIEKLLNLTLEIISLLTREEFMVVRKSSDQGSEGIGSPVSDRCTPSPIVEVSPPQSPTEERILEPSRTYHREIKKVHGDPQDVEVSFSMTDYDYSEDHKDEVMVHPQPHSSAGECSSSNPPERCETPMYSHDYIKEETRIRTPDYQDDPEHEMYHSQYKEEEASFNLIGPGEGSSRDLPERCETPHYPDCIEEETRIIQHEFQAEPVDRMFLPQCKEEDIPTPISSGCDTGTEPAIDPEGGHHGGLDDFPPDFSADPHVTSDCPDRMDQCLECEEYLPNNSELTTHQTTHSTNNLFTCSICGMCFTSKWTFIVHQQSFHLRSHLSPHKSPPTTDGSFPCPECGRCFAKRFTLVRHWRIHSGEKPFHCMDCGKCFAQKYNLVKHQRTHTGERPFACSQCGRCFSDSSSLVRHQRIHSKNSFVF